MTEPPLWQPDPANYAATNVAALAARVGVDSYEALHTWSVDNRAAYWTEAIEDLGIVFRTPPSAILDLAHGVEQPMWLRGARLNIVESCFASPPDAIAVIHHRNGEVLELTMPTSVDETIAPEGQHLVSIFVQYAPYNLAEGDWDSIREDFGGLKLRNPRLTMNTV